MRPSGIFVFFAKAGLRSFEGVSSGRERVASGLLPATMPVTVAR
jgi:hypothetical protein